jgi:hypothetical protein
MKHNYHRQRVAFFIWCFVVSIIIGISFNGCSNQNTVTNTQLEQDAITFEKMTLVEPGTLNEAQVYYKETFDELGLNPQGLEGAVLVNSQDFIKMLVFLGFNGLKPEEIENLPSTELMSRFPNKTLLSAAFFAPKITDVSKNNPNDINIGWRKVVRFIPQNGSEAQRKGIAAGFLLFNKFQGAGNNHNTDPFEPRKDKSNESSNTQLILIRTAQSGLSRPAYFFMYDAVSKNAPLKEYLTASFDARDPNIVSDGRYFVPISCAQCHGGTKNQVVNGVPKKVPDFDRAKLNYLDTDQWFDRTDDNDDFAFVKNTPFGVLYDGGKDESSDKFKNAFGIFRQLNTEIIEQNKQTEASQTNPSFQLRAANKWMELHLNENDISHIDIFARALPPATAGAAQWNANNPVDKELLPTLNQNCFRCHSSLIFNVFDRQAVLIRKNLIAGREPIPGATPSLILPLLDLPLNEKRHMPQDRVLKEEVKEKLRTLLRNLN